MGRSITIFIVAFRGRIRGVERLAVAVMTSITILALLQIHGIV